MPIAVASGAIKSCFSWIKSSQKTHQSGRSPHATETELAIGWSTLMRFRKIVVVATLAVGSFTGALSISPAQQANEVEELARKIAEFSNAKRYSEAIALGQRLLAIIERQFGPDHLNVGTSLNNLADLYRAQARYAEAEPLYKRSLAILEKEVGPDHRYV